MTIYQHSGSISVDETITRIRYPETFNKQLKIVKRNLIYEVTSLKL